MASCINKNISEDISLAELLAVEKVVKSNIERTIAQTKLLLTDLRRDADDIDAASLDRRSQTLLLARKQLQKLLDITHSWWRPYSKWQNNEQHCSGIFGTLNLKYIYNIYSCLKQVNIADYEFAKGRQIALWHRVTQDI